MPATKKAKKWLTENTNAESWQWFGFGLCVDHRCAPNLIQGIEEAGFKHG